MKNKDWSILNELDEFTRAYIECALWASTDNVDETGGEPLDANFDINDIAKESIELMKQDCIKFREIAKDLLNDNHSQNGHDFWLTSCSAGAGFWDRGLENGDKLTELCKIFHSPDLYVGDDGNLYYIGGLKE